MKVMDLHFFMNIAWHFKHETTLHPFRYACKSLVQVNHHFDPNKIVSVDYFNHFNHGLHNKTFTLVSDFVKCYKISFT